jgi:MYXO-CTERM domain-containing protein
VKRWSAALAAVAFLSPGAARAATPCTSSAECAATPDTPVCDLTQDLCVPCLADNGSGLPLSCPDPTKPACTTGRCNECSATNATRCTSDVAPSCNVPRRACGCVVDADCLPKNGKLCDPTAAGGDGRCVPGCKVNGGNDNCPPGQTCTVQDGGTGVCEPSDGGANDGGATDGGDGGSSDGGNADAGDGGSNDGGNGDGGNGDGGNGDGGNGDGGADGGNGDGGNADGGTDGGNADGGADGGNGDGGAKDGGNGDGSAGDGGNGDGGGADAAGDATLGGDSAGASSSSSSSGNGATDDGGLVEGGGCACSSPGFDNSGGYAGMLGLLTGLLAIARRRKRPR